MFHALMDLTSNLNGLYSIRTSVIAIPNNVLLLLIKLANKEKNNFKLVKDRET